MIATVLFLNSQSLYLPTLAVENAIVEFSTSVPGMISVYSPSHKKTFFVHISNIIFWINDPTEKQ